MCMGVGHPIEHCKFFPDYIFLPFMRYESPSLTHYGYWYHWCLGVTCWSSLEIKLETLISVMSYVPIRKFNMLNLLYGYWTRKDWLSYLLKRYKETKNMKDPYIALILHRPYCLSETFKPTGYCYEYTITDGGLKEGALVTLF